MLSKYYKQLLIGATLVCSSLYTMDHVAVAIIPAPHVAVGSDRVTFHGVFPNVAGGNQWMLDRLLQQVQAQNWNGTLEVDQWNDLNMLTAEQLHTLGEAIQNLPIMAGRIVTFAPSVAAPTPMNTIRREVRLATFYATLEVPFIDIGAEELNAIFRVPYGNLILSGAKRAVSLEEYNVPGRTLGTTWKFLGDFIKHYSTGMQEAALLMEDKGIARIHAGDQMPKLKGWIASGLTALKDANDAWNILNAEFEKRSLNPDADKIRNAAELLSKSLQYLFGALGYGGGMDTPIIAILNFLGDLPGDKKFEVYMNCRGDFASDADAAKVPETTAEMLDRLLTKKPNKELAAAVEGTGPGLVKTIRLDNRLWNVTKLDDPQMAKWQENAQNRGWNGWYAGGMNWQFNDEFVQPLEGQFANVARELNLPDGSYAMVVRVPDAGRHVFRILGFRIFHDQWDLQTGMHNAPRASLEKHIGLVEITEAKAGDRTMPMYDPMRTHGLDSIRGTMMEQRIHEAMAEHRVHQFGMLPEGVRNQLKGEVTAYNQQRHQTSLDNQGLGQYALTPDEINLPADALEQRMHAYDRVHDAYKVHNSPFLAELIHPYDRIHAYRLHSYAPKRLHESVYAGQAYGDRLHAIAQNRAAKLSAELTDRLAVDRALHMRTHGGDLTVNPEQHLRVHGGVRVHQLFDPERNHVMRHALPQMSELEREFFGGNKSGGYLDTVETAIATQKVPFDPRNGGRVHYDRDRMHADRSHPGSYGVSIGLGKTPNAAPVSPYENIAQALDDYDQGVADPQFEEHHAGDLGHVGQLD